MNTYKLELAGLKRDLPIIDISDDLSIASFVLLGDTEMTEKAASKLDELIPKVDVFISAEAKGIPLVYELSKLRNIKRYVVCRKSIKTYMTDSIGVSVNSITTKDEQNLYLNGDDIELIKDKDVCILDDVISTGESIKAIEELVIKAGGNIKAKAAILAEGDASERDDIIFLESLPINPKKINI